MISLVTPTGMRPEAFALCERWIANQDYFKENSTPWEWVVIDDGVVETPCTMGQRVIRPEPFWSVDLNTQHRNLLRAMEAVRGDLIFMIEDDDYYGPGYISGALALMNMMGSDVVGEGRARYYNIKHRCYQNLENDWHCSLSQTVFRESAMKVFVDAIKTREKFVDIVFWHNLQDTDLKRTMLIPSRHVVGIKGMPGREGIGSGHTPIDYKDDPSGDVLRSWLGEDARYYEPFLNGKADSKNE